MEKTLENMHVFVFSCKKLHQSTCLLVFSFSAQPPHYIIMVNSVYMHWGKVGTK